MGGHDEKDIAYPVLRLFNFLLNQSITQITRIICIGYDIKLR